jgi:hypothetical protein
MFQSSISFRIRQDDNDNTRSRNSTGGGANVGVVQASNAGVANTATFAILGSITF